MSQPLVLHCRLTENPSILEEQQALQKLLLSTPATRLAAAELITHHIHSSTQQLAATDSPPDGTSMAALDKLQIVQQTVIDSKDASVCQAIWANLSPVLQHRGMPMSHVLLFRKEGFWCAQACYL